MKNIDKLYSSSYVRATSTSKYIAENNNIEVNVINDFRERKFGIESYSELLENFGEKQFLYRKILSRGVYYDTMNMSRKLA